MVAWNSCQCCDRRWYRHIRHLFSGGTDIFFNKCSFHIRRTWQERSDRVADNMNKRKGLYGTWWENQKADVWAKRRWKEVKAGREDETSGCLTWQQGPSLILFAVNQLEAFEQTDRKPDRKSETAKEKTNHEEIKAVGQRNKTQHCTQQWKGEGTKIRGNFSTTDALWILGLSRSKEL